jgi:glycosyltransferase involved in cell wall biosynthesis
MIPTYNCARYLRQTLTSVLEQALPANMMQIEVVDDCSSRDDPEAIVAEIGLGRVSYYRQPRNVGNTANINTCLQRSCGRLVHLLHGDDCVRSGFYQKMQRFFEEYSMIGGAFCRYIGIDEHDHWQVVAPLLQPGTGVIDDWLERIATGQCLQTPSMVVRREVYERLGGFDKRLSYCEDWEMWVRIAAHYPVCYEVEPLALYRVRSESVSGHAVRTGKNGTDIRKAIEINQTLLPGIRGRKLTHKARQHFAFACLRRSRRLFYVGDRLAAFAQIKEAAKTDLSLRTLIAMLFVVMGWAVHVSGGPDYGLHRVPE